MDNTGPFVAPPDAVEVARRVLGNNVAPLSPAFFWNPQASQAELLTFLNTLTRRFKVSEPISIVPVMALSPEANAYATRYYSEDDRKIYNIIVINYGLIVWNP